MVWAIMVAVLTQWCCTLVYTEDGLAELQLAWSGTSGVAPLTWSNTLGVAWHGRQQLRHIGCCYIGCCEVQGAALHVAAMPACAVGMCKWPRAL